jgi:SAM-dependent methyltransferase
MTGKERFFDKDFFDSGEETEARYKSYTVQSILPNFRRQARLLREHFKPSKVLDIGCAKGFLVLALRELGLEAFGVDVSDYAISSAPPEVRQHLFEVDLNNGELPFGDGSFDLVTAYSTFEYLDDLSHALREIFRVIEDGGVLHTEIGYGGYYSKAGDYLVDEYGIRLHDESYWTRTMESFGFEFLRTESGHFYYQALIENALEDGGGLKIRIGRMMSSSKLGRTMLVKYVKRTSKIGLLSFRVRKLNVE